jgi:hypothetical protein
MLRQLKVQRRDYERLELVGTDDVVDRRTTTQNTTSSAEKGAAQQRSLD